MVSCTAVVSVRVFTTSQSSEAHLILFKRLFEIATSDTNIPVHFRHIHGDGFLVWIADAHKGQALGEFGFQTPLVCTSEDVFNRTWYVLPIPMLWNWKVLWIRAFKESKIPWPLRPPSSLLPLMCHPLQTQYSWSSLNSLIWSPAGNAKPLVIGTSSRSCWRSKSERLGFTILISWSNFWFKFWFFWTLSLL